MSSPLLWFILIFFPKQKDIEALVSQIEEDHQADFIPTVIVANAGSFSIGQCDDIQQLQQVANKYQMWLHLDGFYLSTLALSAIPSQVQVVNNYKFCLYSPKMTKLTLLTSRSLRGIVLRWILQVGSEYPASLTL